MGRNVVEINGIGPVGDEDPHSSLSLSSTTEWNQTSGEAVLRQAAAVPKWPQFQHPFRHHAPLRCPDPTLLRCRMALVRSRRPAMAAIDGEICSISMAVWHG